MADFLSFEEAVVLTRNLEDYFNSPASDSTLEFLADHFNLMFKDGFILRISNVVMNNSECMGCNHSGSCVAGCYMTHNGVISYWDKALTKILGAKLVVHEVGHAVYEQVFDDGLDPESHFQASEEFAQYMENHFDRFMQFMVPNNEFGQRIDQETLNLTVGEGSFTSVVIEGIALGLGAAVATVIVKEIGKRIK